MGGGGVRGRRHRVLQAFNRLGPRWSGAITYAPQTQQVGLLGTERLAPHSDQPTDGVLEQPSRVAMGIKAGTPAGRLVLAACRGKGGGQLKKRA